MDILPLASRTLPTTKTEMAECGWDTLDFILITGDAYVDHPSFGAALIGQIGRASCRERV